MGKTMKCRGCGGPINMDDAHRVHFCPYCGLAVKQDETEYDFKRFKLTHEEEVRRRKAEEKKKEERFGWTIILILLAIMVLYNMMLPYLMPK